MTVVLPHFPTSLLREASVQWEPMGMVVGGGQSASGLMPVTRLDGGGLWKASLVDVSLRTANHVRAWRALAAICEGGVQPIVVPMCDKRFFPAPTVGNVRLTSYDQVLHESDNPFLGGHGYRYNVVDATIVGGAALRATSLTIDVAYGGDLMGGEHFAIDDITLRWRLYRVATVSDNGDGTWDITIRPPLRAAVEDGVRIFFDQPKCVMRLAKSSAMDVMLEHRKRGSPSVDFVEAFPPFPA